MRTIFNGCSMGVHGGLWSNNQNFSLWEELGAVKGLWDEPWCIGGDFNIFRFPWERNREGRISRDMRRFTQVIEEMELKEVPLPGGFFTWRGGLNNQRMARLDRFLVSENWDSHFRGVVQCILSKPTSDHCPIMLEGRRGVVRGPISFRFENMWFKDDGFKGLVRSWW